MQKIRSRILPKNYLKLRKTTFVVSVILLLVGIIIINVNSKRHKITGWLSVRGEKIYDQSFRQVVIKGINYNELNPLDYVYTKPDLSGLPSVCQRWTKPPVDLDAKLVNDMGFNAVRLIINWDKLEMEKPRLRQDGNIVHKWNTKYLEAIDQTVRDLKKYQIAVILDMHQYLWSSAFKYIESEDGSACSGGGFPGWIYSDSNRTTFQKARCDFFADRTLIYPGYSLQDGFIDAWKLLAGRYKENSTVIAADIINEPWAVRNICTPEELKLDEFYDKIGGAIRSVNPRITLIFEDSQDYPDWELALNKPPKFKNSIYSFHLYTGNWENDGLKRLNRFQGRAQKWKMPLFVGEYDGYGYASNINAFPDKDKKLTEIKKTVDYFQKNNIHWAFWSYSGLESIIDPENKEIKKELLESLNLDF